MLNLTQNIVIVLKGFFGNFTSKTLENFSQVPDDDSGSESFRFRFKKSVQPISRFFEIVRPVVVITASKDAFPKRFLVEQIELNISCASNKQLLAI
jgi:hypothetical protein